MASWRENVSSAAQEDLDGLLDVALDMAESRIAEQGEFFPFGLIVTKERMTEVVSVGPVPAQQAQQLTFRAIGKMRQDIRAGAVVTDVRLPETGGDAIDVHLEHGEGVALSVVEPYRVVDGEVRAEDLSAHSATRKIWS